MRRKARQSGPLVTALLLAGAALAEAPETSLRPRPRPAALMTQPSLPAVDTISSAAASPGQLRPRPRPAVLTTPTPSLPVVETVSSAMAAPGQLRPRPRPVALLAAAMPPRPAPAAVLRPLPRPAALGQAVALAASAIPGVLSPGPDTPRPRPRPAALAASPTAPAEPQADGAADKPGLFAGLFGKKDKAPPRKSSPVAGSVCGDPEIRGEDIAAITSRVAGCGVAEPVRVTAIGGIRLNSPATVNCTTARALKDWVTQNLQPAFRGREIVELRIAASYICRPRNNVRGAKISEHGRGNAVDVAGLVFADGTLITVEDDFSKLRKAYKAACGTFGTTLGPGSDGYHEDHMHFDVATGRSGPYCR